MADLDLRDITTGKQSPAKGKDGALLVAGSDGGAVSVSINQQFGYEIVAASQTAEPLGTTGAAGDFLHAVIVQANTGTITILDGATTFFVIPAAVAVGTMYVIDATAATAWKITTPASTSAIGVGNFT